MTFELPKGGSHMTSELSRVGSHMTSELSRGESHMTSESDLLQGSSHVIFERTSEDGHVTSELPRRSNRVTSDFPQEPDPDPDSDLLDSSSRYLPVTSPVPEPGHELNSMTTHGNIQEPGLVPRPDDRAGLGNIQEPGLIPRPDDRAGLGNIQEPGLVPRPDDRAGLGNIQEPGLVPRPDNGTGLGSSTTTEQDVGTLTTSLVQAYGLPASAGATTELFSSLTGTGVARDAEAEDGGHLELVVSDSPSKPSIGSVSASYARVVEPRLSERLAAVRIQAAARGYLVRRHLKAYVQQHWAATVIQAAW